MQNNKYFVVLLVEDNPDDIIATQRAWKKCNITNELRVVNNGEECLDYLHRRGEYSDPDKAPRPKLLIIDLKMPRMDGLTLVEHIRGDVELLHLPIVILTTSKAEEDRVKSYELGVNAFIMKPIGFNALSEAVRTINLFWELAELPD